ncbi:zinc-ribbon domain-containing protein [Luxibacter massiliensis]|uniref:zinc-ribbon domain-containing protein n=1 Tax=Luxibacter massiliensis TaxID=2219695 RepID=UPI000F05F986|nr:zinc-ribbon domain-containing protein [Luxibacter massiliensis]
MKTFFEDLGRKIGETAETVTNRASEAVEVQRIRNQIRSLERGNERDYMDLGRIVYRYYKDGGDVGEEAESYCQAVKDRKETILEYEKEAAEIKGNTRCKDCGQSVAKDMVYCPYCGTKVTEGQGDGSFSKEARKMAEDMEGHVRETAEAVADTVKEKAGDVAEKAQEAAGKMKDRTEEAASRVIDKTEEAADRMWDKTASAADTVRDKAAETADMMRDRVSGAADTVKEKAAETADTMKEKTADLAESMKEKAADAAETVKEKAEKLEEKMKGFTQE